MTETWLQIAVVVLVVAMTGSMGVELEPADFRRVLRQPRATIVGLSGQLLLLPVLTIAFAYLGGLEAELAAGAMIIAACPGGPPSNVFTFLAGANTALSITLTALSSVLTILTTPLWIWVGIRLFLHDSATVEIPVERVVGQLFFVILVPIAAGMSLRAKRPAWAARIRRHLRPVLATTMAASFVLIVLSQGSSLVYELRDAAPAAAALSVLALGTAQMWGRLWGLSTIDAFTVSIEVGLQNGALAALIVVNLLGRLDLIAFPGAYALIAFVPVTIWTAWFRRR